VLNAANEVAVARFLADDLGYADISRLIDACLQAHSPQARPSLEEVVEADAWARTYATSWTRAY
jgi:1-deoxy-D-xylulose-5-phosphate reductoisomerase